MALDLTTQLFVNGAWTTYTSYSEYGWSTRIGPDVESGLTPNKIEFTLANDDLSMDPTNVESALYGKIGPNTKTRLRIGGTSLTQAEASHWEPDRTVDHQTGVQGLSWVTLTAEGLLRRIGRWEDPLDSPMRRQVSSYSSLTGYMPLEDPSGAAALTQLVTGVKAGFWQGSVSLAADDGAGGSDRCVTISTGGVIAGTFRTPSGNGYQICWLAKLAALPSSTTDEVLLQWTDTLNRTWRWKVDDTQFIWDVTDADGTSLSLVASTFGGASPNQWLRYRMKVTVSGSTLTYEPAWYVQDASVIIGTSATFSSSSTGRPKSWRADGNAWTDGAAYGHVFAVTDTSLSLTGDSNAVQAFNGYLGERAGHRFSRLLGEQGLTGYVGGDADLAAPMGRQKPGKLQDLLQECADTDGGLIYDEPTDIGLTIRLNNDMINRAPALALTYGVDISPPFRKIIGDVRVANDITVTNWDGTSERLELTAGAKSTQPPPAGVGRYKLPLAVSVEQPWQLLDRGNWELADRTLNRPRYAAVVLNLHALAGSYRTAVNAMRPGDLISVAGVEPDTVYLRVINIERRGDAVEDIATLNCLPADVWLTGTYDDTAYRIDSSTTTLGSTVTSTATSLTFSYTHARDGWSTTAEPYDVLIAGERITVTSMGAASGTGPYTQTATVTRSVNGVVKALTAGEPIHVFRPARYSLGGV